MTIKRTLRFLFKTTLAITLPLTSYSQAVLTGSITETEINFTLTGTVPAGITSPSNDAGILYIGDPSNTNWIDATIGSYNGSKVFSGTIDGWNVSDVYVTSSSSADYVAFTSGGWDFDFTNGGSINASLTVTANSALFNPSEIDLSDLIVTWGSMGTPPFPNSTTQIGAYQSSVPEPSTYAALSGLAVLCCAFLRRHRRTLSSK